MTSSWFIRPRPQPAAKRRLIRFPHAGGAASLFVPWAKHFGDDIEVCCVQLPGRMNRLKESPINRLPAIVERCLPELLPLLDIPFILVGHSLGALIAFEITRALRSTQQRSPEHLIVSARRGPRLPLGRDPICDLPDATFIREVDRIYGAVPAAVRAEPDLLAMVLPALRADMQAYEHYTYSAEAPLACPITAWFANDDPTTSKIEIEPWREETSGAFALQEFSGGHLFLQPAQATVFLALDAITGG